MSIEKMNDMPEEEAKAASGQPQDVQAEPTAALSAEGADPAQEDESAQDPSGAGEGGSGRRKGVMAAWIIVATVVAAACLAGIAALATPKPLPEADPPSQKEVVADAQDRRYSLAVKVEAEGWTDAATKAVVRVEAAGHDALELEVACNEEVELVDASSFECDVEYKVSVVRAPVLEDGSTYTPGEPVALKALPDSTAAGDASVRSAGFEFDDAREDAELFTSEVSQRETRAVVVVKLAPKAAADMSVEEKDQAASALESSGNAVAAQAVKQSAKEQASGGGSAPAPDPEPEPPAHVHN